MESSVFRRELKVLEFKNIPVSVTSSKAREAYNDLEIKNLIPYFDKSLDEYVHILLRSPVVQVNNSSIYEFLLINKIIKEAISEDKEIIRLYEESIEERGAVQFPILDEISLIIVTAFLTGFFTELAKTIIGKIFKTNQRSKVELRKALDLMLSNSILELLERHVGGMTVKMISEAIKIDPENAGYFISKYEDRGWVSKEIRDRKEIWVIKKKRADIIESFFSK